MRSFSLGLVYVIFTIAQDFAFATRFPFYRLCLEVDNSDQSFSMSGASLNSTGWSSSYKWTRFKERRDCENKVQDMVD